MRNRIFPPYGGSDSMLMQELSNSRVRDNSRIYRPLNQDRKHRIIKDVKLYLVVKLFLESQMPDVEEQADGTLVFRNPEGPVQKVILSSEGRRGVCRYRKKDDCERSVIDVAAKIYGIKAKGKVYDIARRINRDVRKYWQSCHA